MGFKLFKRHNQQVEQNPVVAQAIEDSEPVVVVDEENQNQEVIDEKAAEKANAGLAKVEAMNRLWTKPWLYAAYGLAFLVFFVISLEESIQGSVTSYVTSSFALLPLTATAGIISNVIGGVLRIPIGKFVDCVGRAEGFVVMTAVAMIGLIMMTYCQNVQTYAAAQVFYWAGFDGMQFVLSVFLGDTTSLKNRAFALAFSMTPYVVTTFIGPVGGKYLIKTYPTNGFRIAYGLFAIITPLAAAPICYTLFHQQKKAIKQGLLAKKEKSGRSITESIKHYFWEFDIVGLVLACTGFSMLLLPFSLATYQPLGYRSPVIISMIVIGASCLIIFPFHEKYWAKNNFIPYDLLTDRSVIGACLTSMFFFISFYCWDSTFNTYLQVVHNLPIHYAGYISSIYSIVACFWGPVIGLLIRWSGRFKYIGLASLFLQLSGIAMMILFRQPGWNIGFVILCQVCIAIGGGGMVICQEMAVMAAGGHENTAGMLALIGLFTSVGGGIGQAISGTIYTNLFPAALDMALPGDAALNARLYGSLVEQLSFPVGSPERAGVIAAYAYTMRYLTIAGTAFLVPCIAFILMWKNADVSDLKKDDGSTKSSKGEESSETSS